MRVLMTGEPCVLQKRFIIHGIALATLFRAKETEGKSNNTMVN